MSYGTPYADALHDDWGPGPFSDVDAGVSSLVVRGVVDPRAIAIYGGSYGGYLAAYAVSHSDRYAAATIDDGVVDLRTFYAEHYSLQSRYLQSMLDGTPWDQPDTYAAQSPITAIDKVHTPVLMRFGGASLTHDFHPPYMATQGFELYAALHDRHVPTEFVFHPDQGHAITDWSLFRDWVARNLRWYDYWLSHVGANPAAAIN
jgi:dipeptidyl aminopeptidase/acylaminoacyl peptidase